MAKHKWELSLKEIAATGIADIFGYVSSEFGDPTFKITRIALEDGAELAVEGEHDFPYIADYKERLTLPPEEEEDE